MNYSDKLRTALRKKGITQEQLAEKLGKDKATINRKLKNDSFDKIEKYYIDNKILKEN